MKQIFPHLGTGDERINRASLLKHSLLRPEVVAKNPVVFIDQPATAKSYSHVVAGSHCRDEPLNQLGFARIVAVCENDELPSRQFDALITDRNPSPVLLAHYQPDPRIILIAPKYPQTVVGRAIIDNDDFNVRISLRNQGLHALRKVFGMVVARYHDAY
jgi:hypothetical protein